MERSQGRGKFLRLSLSLLLATLLLACMARHGGLPPSDGSDTAMGGGAGTEVQRTTPGPAMVGLPRPSPSYVQWLERQSLRV